MTFSPPPNAVQHAVRPKGDRWQCVGWIHFEQWRSKNGTPGYKALGESLGCSPALISGWKKGTPPSKVFQQRVEALAGVPPEAWSWWVADEGADAASADPPSRRRPAPVATLAQPAPAPGKAPGPAPAPGRPQSVRERLEEMAHACQEAIQRALSGEASAAERDQGKLARALLQDLARVRAELRTGSITDHPDYAELVRDLVDVIVALLGEDAPDELLLKVIESLDLRAAARRDRSKAAA